MQNPYDISSMSDLITNCHIANKRSIAWAKYEIPYMTMEVCRFGYIFDKIRRLRNFPWLINLYPHQQMMKEEVRDDRKPQKNRKSPRKVIRQM